MGVKGLELYSSTTLRIDDKRDLLVQGWGPRTLIMDRDSNATHAMKEGFSDLQTIRSTIITLLNG